jgi:hypothetical protein
VRDNPGQPGKGGPKLVRASPLRGAQAPGAEGRHHQLLWMVSQPSGNANQELRGKARSETATEPSQADRTFRPGCRCSYPEGMWLLLQIQHGDSESEAALAPSEGPRSHHRGAKRQRDVGERAGQAMPAKPPRLGRRRKARSPNCNRKGNLRGKRSDP